MTTTGNSQKSDITHSGGGGTESTAKLTDEGVLLSVPARDTLGFDGTQGIVAIASLVGTGPSLFIENSTCTLGSWLAEQLGGSNPETKLLRTVTLPNQRFTALVQPQQVSWGISQTQSPLARVRHELGNRINNIHVNAELIALWTRQAEDHRLLIAAQRILDECARSHQITTEQFDPDNLDGAHMITLDRVMPFLLVTAQSDEPSLNVTVSHRPLVTSALVLQTAHFLNRIAQVSRYPIQASFHCVADTDSILNITVSGFDPFVPVGKSIVAEWEGHRRAEPSLLDLPSTINAFQLTQDKDALYLNVA